MDASVKKIITERVEQAGRGSFFFAQDFSDVAPPDAVRKSLQRLVTDGLIIRVAPGIYYYPKIDNVYGLGIIKPGISDIAEAIARRDNALIAPTGPYALNMLGLSTQVPVNAVYITTGSSRNVPVGTGKGIQFIHTDSTKKLGYQSRLMMLIVSALREIGKNRATAEELKIIKQHLDKVSSEDFSHDIKLAPIWVRKTLYSL